MRIDELNADEFLASAALVAEGVQDVLASESGRELAASLSTVYGTEGKSDEQKGAEVLQAVLGKLPALLRENGDAVYKILAALDGQTVDEYKAGFKASKLAADVKAAVKWVTANEEEAEAFLAS